MIHAIINKALLKTSAPQNYFWTWGQASMISTMASSNGNIFRSAGLLFGEFTVTDDFPTPVTRSFDVFFDLRLNKRLSEQS